MKREINYIKKQYIDVEGNFDFISYHAALKEHNRLQKLKYRKPIPLVTQFKRYQYSAVKRHLSFELSFDQFSQIIVQPCSYCGTTPSKGIDRVHSSKGYIDSNCTPCCGMCNKMKYVFSVEVFKAHVNKIHSYLYGVQP